MKQPIDIDTPLKVKASKWSDLIPFGTLVDKVLYLNKGVRTGLLEVSRTKIFKEEWINKIKERIINIENLTNYEEYKYSNSSEDS